MVCLTVQLQLHEPWPLEIEDGKPIADGGQ